MSSVVVKGKPKEQSVAGHRELTPEDIQKIAGTCHAWRGDVGAPPRGCPPDRAGTGACPYEYGDIRHQNDGLIAELREQTAHAQRLDPIIWANPEDIGYGG